MSFQPINLGYFENSVLVSGYPGGGMILRTGDILRIETHEFSTASDDGPGTDAVWNDIARTFETAAIEDLGNFASVTSMRTSGGAGPFGTDTEIALYNSDGVLQRSNDDFDSTSGSGFSGLTLADGTYYLTVVPYDAAFANGLVRPGFAGTGDFTLAFNGVTVDTATLSAYSTLWYRFTIGAPACVANVDDGSGTGTPDGGVGIDDLLYYLGIFDAGLPGADLDDGSAAGTPDGGVTIDDLLYFLFRFDAGC